MRIVEWDNRYNTGIKQFDSDHLHLLNLLNQTYNAVIINQSKHEMEYIVHELIDYAANHFKAEEELLGKYNYPQIDAHIQEHEVFSNQIMNYINKFLAGESLLTIEIILFLEEWLLKHISKADKEYSKFLIDKGIT